MRAEKFLRVPGAMLHGYKVVSIGCGFGAFDLGLCRADNAILMLSGHSREQEKIISSIWPDVTCTANLHAVTNIPKGCDLMVVHLPATRDGEQHSTTDSQVLDRHQQVQCGSPA